LNKVGLVDDVTRAPAGLVLSEAIDAPTDKATTATLFSANLRHPAHACIDCPFVSGEELGRELQRSTVLLYGLNVSAQVKLR
jgi:hypothetical protein